MGDPACNARPSAGYVPDHANILLRNPKEIVLHNLVLAEAEIRICFSDFNSMSGCDQLIVRAVAHGIPRASGADLYI